jgi:hypothetical protein
MGGRTSPFPLLSDAGEKVPGVDYGCHPAKYPTRNDIDMAGDAIVKSPTICRVSDEMSAKDIEEEGGC